MLETQLKMTTISNKKAGSSFDRPAANENSRDALLLAPNAYSAEQITGALNVDGEQGLSEPRSGDAITAKRNEHARN